MDGRDTYEYNTHVAPSPSLRSAALSGKSKIRQVWAFGLDLAKGSGNAIVDGTRRKVEGRRISVSGREIGDMSTPVAEKCFEVQSV